MLLQRKSIAFVAPPGVKYLSFMLLKVRKWAVISPAKNYQNSLKRALLRRNKLHWPRLIWPTGIWFAFRSFSGRPFFPKLFIAGACTHFSTMMVMIMKMMMMMMTMQTCLGREDTLSRRPRLPVYHTGQDRIPSTWEDIRQRTLPAGMEWGKRLQNTASNRWYNNCRWPVMKYCRDFGRWISHKPIMTLWWVIYPSNVLFLS